MYIIIQRLTKGVLKTLTNNNRLHALRTDDVVVFTGKIGVNYYRQLMVNYFLYQD